MHIHKLRKKIKKKKEGKYLTKKYILKKLYLKEKEFRKLCIFKGIYPKDFKEIPLKYRKKFYKHKVYYSKNDYKSLSHEKIIQDFRKITTCLKKYKKYKIALEDEEKCKKIIKNFPTYSLDHIIKERFPIFSYAIEQLDDALSSVIAYSLLPSDETFGIKNNFVKNCQMLKNQFHYYIYKTSKIKKGFISVKGYYLQAQILQKKVTWLIPHVFTPYLDKSIDFSIITTFIEYYISFLKFVLFKLYKMDNMTYPPEQNEKLKNEKLNHLSYDEYFISFCKSKLVSEDDQLQIEKTNNEKNSNGGMDHTNVSLIAQAVGELTQENNRVMRKKQIKHHLENLENLSTKEQESSEQRTEEQVNHNINNEHDNLKELFTNQVYYIHTDMPFDILSIIILSCGGSIAWNSPYSPYTLDDEKITHEILESREVLESHEGQEGITQVIKQNYQRMYIQPQYIFDCLNRKKILPCSDYSTDVKKLPVHLSPFIEDDNFKNFVKKEEYTINKILNQDAEIYNNGNNASPNAATNYDHAERTNNDNELLKSDDEINNVNLQKFRNACLNNQMELENEDNYMPKMLNSTNGSQNDNRISQLDETRQNVHRQKMALSKKKRKLYARIERSEKKQKATIEKFINKAKWKKQKAKK
ncbi:pescadillo N-terminus domain containing protein [Plasmodium gonderi]|uniref:Pescadillo homolog n=1 Tax=Plasmodium gonderi TaxID=77519 RepID=A0A1Y1JHP2_PLAGO|nr:pescadillo N-terminus domain containing protein [Plasmodium gonderi]GAW80855.1 pescadillo N-terminus domain containing protein [Plasmodium gonderi]